MVGRGTAVDVRRPQDKGYETRRPHDVGGVFFGPPALRWGVGRDCYGSPGFLFRSVACVVRVVASTGAQIRFEAAVGGGVPLIQGVREGLAGDNLTRVIGILNGTSNYVLSRMEAGEVSMASVLDAARRLGYAEADPSADIDGDDAAAKLVVLGGIAFGRHVPLAEVPRRSIRPIAAADFRYATRLGCTIRQIAVVEAAADGTDALHAFVGPALVPAGSSFGRNEGADNIVTLRGQYGGSSSFSRGRASGAAT